MTPAQDLRFLGRAVRATRKRLGIQQRDLAGQLRVPQAWLSKVEMGTITGLRPLQYPERVQVLRRWIREQVGGDVWSVGGDTNA